MENKRLQFVSEDGKFSVTFVGQRPLDNGQVRVELRLGGIDAELNIVKTVIDIKFKSTIALEYLESNELVLLFDTEKQIDNIALYLDVLGKELMSMIELRTHSKTQGFSWVEQEHLFN